MPVSLAKTQIPRLRTTNEPNEGLDSARALLFGHMAKIAAQTVQHYHSDLYHDVRWILENVHGPKTFAWFVKECGTYLGDSAYYGPLTGVRGQFYEVELFVEGWWWTARFTQIPHEEVCRRIMPPCQELSLAGRRAS